MNSSQSHSRAGKVWKPLLAVCVLGSIGALSAAGWTMWRDMSEVPEAFVFYTVTEGDLPIVVTERGNLESQMETTIRCEVENVTYDRSGNNGTQIIFIVPNGSAVKEGELLIELDSAAIRDKLDQQELAYERAKSQQIQATAKYENQKTQNETALAQAQLNVELAALELRMYMDEERGTFKLSKEEVERQIDEARNLILESQVSLEMAKTTKTGVEALFKLGYKGKNELDKTRFDFLKAESRLAQSMNQLNNYESDLERIETYEFEKQKLTLEGDVATAKRNLAQVLTDNQSLLAQAEAAKIEADKAADKEQEVLVKLETQLDRCKIYAPHDGMVVYARENHRYSSGSEIAEGVTVRQRQEILTLPDLSKMQVKTQIHEAVLDQVQPGLPTTVRVDAFPTRTYKGVVSEVAVVPGRSWYSNVKTYDCEVQILEEVEQLKPGMTAVVDIHVERIENILSIPVQAVVQVESETWCYADSENGVKRRDIQLGRSNDKFVHVTDGLEQGDRIVLNPMVILEQEKSSREIASDAGVQEAPDIPEEVLKKAAEAKKQKKRPSPAGIEKFKRMKQRSRGKGRSPRPTGDSGD